MGVTTFKYKSGYFHEKVDKEKESETKYCK